MLNVCHIQPFVTKIPSNFVQNLYFVRFSFKVLLKTSQEELQMLSNVTLNCQVTKIVMNSSSQLSEL